MRAGRRSGFISRADVAERPAEAPRLGDHTTADDASRYRPADEVKEHWKQEPIARWRAYLVSRMNWSKTDEEKVARECEQRVEAAIERYLASKPRPPQSMFDHLYARLPAAYVAQRQILRTTIAAALYLISENRKLDEVKAKLAPGEIERVIDIVQCWPDSPAGSRPHSDRPG